MTLLKQFGVRTIQDRVRDGRLGFPVSVSLSDGNSLAFDLPEPGLLQTLDPTQVGAVVIGHRGKVVRTWGLADRLALFRNRGSMLDTALGSFIEAAFDGSQGSCYLDGVRYYSSGLLSDEPQEIVILAVNAHEEREYRREHKSSQLHVSALKRLGKVFTMNQQVQHIVVAAAHEIASALELAAVLIWTVQPDEDSLELTASVGANRSGTNILHRLAVEGGSSCVAELVATTRNPFFAPSVEEHLMTCDLEAKFCYLRPGGISVHPLVISDRLLGVVEIIGRQEDSLFDGHQSLFQTIAEHFALALNAAVMFEEFEKLATHDALTGIANHRSMQEFLHQRVLEAARTGQELGVVMIDVDHFRSFNEEEGHDAGDEVLRRVASALRSCVRPYDLAARYGGEEFTVVMPGSSPANTHSIAERIRAHVEALEYRTRSGMVRNITVSLGYATFPNGGVDAPDILKAADVALFEAKRSGRNRVVSFQGQSLTMETRHDDLNLAAVLSWVPRSLQRQSEDLYNQCLQDIVTISAKLNLTGMQTAILQALVRITPTYRYARKRSPEMLQRMTKSPEFRTLAPHLEALEDRFDERGPSQPILARVLAAILAAVQDKGRALVQDPGRFDPDILRHVLDRRRAA